MPPVPRPDNPARRRHVTGEQVTAEAKNGSNYPSISGAHRAGDAGGSASAVQSADDLRPSLEGNGDDAGDRDRLTEIDGAERGDAVRARGAAAAVSAWRISVPDGAARRAGPVEGSRRREGRRGGHCKRSRERRWPAHAHVVRSSPGDRRTARCRMGTWRVLYGRRACRLAADYSTADRLATLKAEGARTSRQR